MRVENNVPEIRFKGFSGEWESKKLGNTVTYIKGFAFKSSDYGSHGTRIVRVSDLTRSSLSGSSGKIYISNSKAGLYSNYEIKSGDIVITTVGSKAEMRESAVGRAIVFTKSEGHLLNQNLVKVTPANENESQFIYNQLLREQYARFIEDIQRGNANQANIAIGDLWEYSLKFPKTKPEQTAIGNTFQKLDNLINQHQQKHDKLSNIKKAMLEKMFPKQGETIPEIRFKGFSGEWEERSLTEEAVVTTGYPFDSADFSEDGDLLVITNGNIQNSSSAVDGNEGNRIASEKVAHLNQYKLNLGDILVTMDGSVGRTAKVIDRNQILAQRVGRLVARNNTEFLYQSLNTGAFLETMTTISHGGTIKHISLSEIGSYIVQVPKDLNEQAKIGAYLKKLDDLIERHQQQITKLNNIKQACLSKMFV